MTTMDATLSLVTAGEGVAAAHSRGLRSKVMITNQAREHEKAPGYQARRTRPDHSGVPTQLGTNQARTDMQLIWRSLPGSHTLHSTSGHGVSSASAGGAA